MSDVQINLELVTKAFETALDNSKRKTEEFSNQASKNFTAVGNTFNVMAGNLAANAVGKALGFVSDSFGRMIDEAKEAEDVANNLKIALNQAGLTSTTTQKHFLDLAESISNVTTYDDELIASSTGLLATLTNLNKEGLEKATRRSVDLAAALGIDLSSATDLVNKAINGNTTAFSKLGIQIEKGTSDQDRLNKLMQATEKYVGSAEAKTNTYTGAMAQQDVALGNLLGTFGSLITQNSNVVGGIKSTTGIFQSLNEFVQSNSVSINQFIESLKISVPIIAAVGGAIGLSALGFTGLAAAATAAWTAVTGPIGLAVIAIGAITTATYLVYKNFDLIKASAYDALAATIEFAAKGAGLFSADKSQALLDQANAYRQQATEIRNTAKAAQEAAALKAELVSQENAQAEAAALRLKEQETAKQESLQATQTLRQELRLAEAEAKVADDANELMRTNANFKALVEQLGLEAAVHRQAQYNITTDRIENEKLRLQTQVDTNKKRIKDIQENHKKVEEAEKEQIDKLKAGRVSYVSWEEQNEQQRVSTTKDTLGSISTLTRSSNSELFEIGKAAAITTATIDGFAAVQKALASLPPPFNFVAAALVGTATAANVASIAGQQRPKFANGGIVPGSSFGGDRVAAQVNSGEMILNKTQQGKLFQQINGGSSSNETNQLLAQLINLISNQSTSVQIDGREIVSVVRDQIASGRAI